jgi:hypothetical protein
VFLKNRSRGAPILKQTEKMKKKLIIIATVLLLPLSMSAQNVDDALRYSKLFYQGTARFDGMSGAFTALGGDLSAISLNPAGIAVFRSTEFTVSTQVNFKDNNSNFAGYNNEYQFSQFSLGQIGLVTAMTMGNGSGLKSLSFGYSYNRTNNYNTHIIIDGISDASSMADYWADLATGYNTWELENSTSAGYMAYQQLLIDTISNSFTDYASIFYYREDSPEYGQQTKRTIDNAGFTGEHTIVLGANLADKLYIGAGFGITTIVYTGHYRHTEIDAANNVYDFVDFTYTDHFDANGTGWNFKIGAIFRPVEMMRIGFSFATPTYYNIDEYYFSNLSSYLNLDTPNDPTDDFEGITEMDPNTYHYELNTPYRINTGIAFQIGTMGLISADYEYVDYSNAQFRHGADGYDFYNENEDIRYELKGASNFRIGAELRFGPAYIRGGYKYYGSAFKSGSINEDADYNGYSAGIGYRQNKFYLDLSFSGLINYENYLMYPNAWLEPVNMHNHDKILTGTVGLKF